MREHILSVAERLFYSEGIRAVGVDRVVAEAKVAKATLYRHFPAKDALVEGYLLARHTRVVTTLRADLGPDFGEPRERLLKLFDVLEAKANEPTFRGCAFLLAVAESEGSESVLKLARKHKRSIREIILEMARLLPVDAEELATDLALCYEGALATMAISRDSCAAQTAKRCAAIILDAALASRTT